MHKQREAKDQRAHTPCLACPTVPAGVQWELLHGLLEMAIYGGRVDNVFDGKVLRTYLNQFFSPEVLGLNGGKVKPLPGSRTAVPTSGHKQDYVQVRGH